MHVIIAGAGVGGLTAALALARQGVDCTVLERAETLEEIGAGLQLSPNACRVLFGLDLENSIRAIAFAPERVRMRDAANGRALLGNRLGAFAEARWGAPYLQARRADVQAMLLDAVLATGTIDLQLGRAVVAVDQTASGVAVICEGGETAAGDALIGCDGLNSTVRAALWGATPARFTGQTAWRGLARAQDLPPALAREATVWAGPGRHFVHYPVGGGLVNMVAVIEARGERSESWTAAGDPAVLAAAFADWPQPVRAIIGAVQAPWRSALFDRPALPRWSKGRATLLGDAAHPMLPFLAQGAAMAIEDAAALAHNLLRGGAVEHALAAYEASRRPRTAKVQAWSRRNARLFHLPSPALAGVFGAAAALDRIRGRPGEARFDWLYGQ